MTNVGSTELITDSSELLSVIDQCFKLEAYALDTEFHREKSYYPKLALLQINFGTGVALVDPTAISLIPLQELFHSEQIAVMHACAQDLEVLQHYCKARPKEIFDTQIAAGFLGLRTPSLSALHERFLKKKLPKGERLTDWLQRPLSKRQIEYAAADVADLLEIFEILTSELIKRERLDWAKKEFEVVKSRMNGSKDPSESWIRIKETRHLGAKGRGVAQAIAEWRETEAQSLDVPVRFILSDIAVVSISQKVPKTIDELLAVRGVDKKRFSGDRARKILELVSHGKDKKVDIPSEKNEKQLDLNLRPAVALISAWLAQFAKDSDLDPALLGTRADIESLLRGDSQSRLSEGWRHEYVGVPIQKLVEGSASLAFVDGRLRMEDR
tara:strand:- start:295 stop:1446 length:1152 start_codon:yes stop_codon:yes gene_type:complete